MKREIITITENGKVYVPANVQMRDFEIASLFGIIVPTVKGKIKQVLKDGVCQGDFTNAGTVVGNSITPDYYGLDMVVALAFRIQSPQAKMFRKWVLERMVSTNTTIQSSIAVNKPTDWRKCFIEYPQIYDELYDKKISWWYWDDKKSDGEISLLSKTRWSSRHKELRTYYWYLKFKNEHDTYTDSTSEYTPFTATFTRETVDISVQYRPLWDNGIEGEYVINNATANDKITFKTGEYEKVEAYLHQCLFML